VTHEEEDVWGIAHDSAPLFLSRPPLLRTFITHIRMGGLSKFRRGIGKSLEGRPHSG
jgi:hypothetical protein